MYLKITDIIDIGSYDDLSPTLSLSVAQEMLSASISQTRILQTCGVPHPNMVSSANPLQGNEQTHTHTCTHARCTHTNAASFLSWLAVKAGKLSRQFVYSLFNFESASS